MFNMNYPELKNESQKRLKEIEKELTKDEVVSDAKKMAELGKEQIRLKDLISKIERLENLEKEIKETGKIKALKSDKGMEKMAKDELKKLKKERKELQDEIKSISSPPDPNDQKNAILEIRAGTGGDEAELFGADLFRMYSRFAEKHGYRVDVSSKNKTPIGGIKELIAEVKGKGAYGDLKFEAGVHRVQRIPETEKSGRVHTSAATVAVLPEAEEKDIEIKDEDLRIDTYRSSGAGGQHVNVTDSAVRITHLPTNTVVSCQDERSQIKNRAKALKILRSRLLRQKQEEEMQKTGAVRKSMVGTGDRSEKIRTYNFPQNRVTDHRSGFTSHNLPQIMGGNLDKIISSLKNAS